MSPKEYISIASILFGFVAAWPYVRGIIAGQTKPHMFSWLIWGIVCGTGAAVQIAEKGGAGSWYFVVNSIYCLSIAVASFWIGTRDIKRTDWLVLIIALSAVPIWVLTQNPLWSLAIIIGIDGLAYVPTIRKSWTHPDQESALSWFLSVICFSLSILALETYTVTTYLYPATFVAVNLGLTALLLMRRKVLNLTPEQAS